MLSCIGRTLKIAQNKIDLAMDSLVSFDISDPDDPATAVDLEALSLNRPKLARTAIRTEQSSPLLWAGLGRQTLEGCARGILYHRPSCLSLMAATIDLFFAPPHAPSPEEEKNRTH